MKKRWAIISVALAFFIISMIISYFANVNLYKVYPNLPVANDFLLNHLPFLNILWFADLVLILASISFVIFLFSKKRIKNFPFYAIVIGIYNLLRALFIYLTPLGNPHPLPGINIPFLPNGGMFPSGHCGTIFLFFLFALKDKSKNWRIYFLILLVIEIVSMILSRGHYSIDIIGALFIAFAVWKVTDEHFKKNLVLR
jgi:membrane-associated phospholipid phosphatase